MKRVKKNSVGTIVVWLLLFVVVIAIVVMGRLGKKDEILEEVQEKSVLVSVQEVVLRSIHDTVELPGRVEANISVMLATEKGGRVIELLADRGDLVAVGDVLLRIDGRHWSVMQKRASIELVDAKRDLDRWEKLKADGAVSSSEFDVIQRRHDFAKVAVEEASVHIDQCRVVSPIDGVVDGRYVELGEYAGEAKPVFKVVSMGTLKVKLDVPEQDISSVKTGSELLIKSVAINSGSFSGKVSFVAVDGDAPSNTFPVELKVENPPAGLKPGMIVDVALLRSSREDAVVVPFAAVVPKRGEHVVFVVEGSSAVLRVVHVDAIVGQEAVLSSGLSDGDLLVVEGQRTLQDGARVRL